MTKRSTKRGSFVSMSMPSVELSTVSARRLRMTSSWIFRWMESMVSVSSNLM